MRTRAYRETAAGREPFSPAQRVLAGLKHLIENWAYQLLLPGRLIQKKYTAFEQLRHRDVRALEIISRLEEIQQRNLSCDIEHIKALCLELTNETRALTDALRAFHPVRYALLANYQQKYSFYARLALLENTPLADPPYVQTLRQPLPQELAGGKGAALSYVHSHLEIPVPPGIVITTRAFHHFLGHNNIQDFIDQELACLKPEADQEYSLVSRRIQEKISQAELPASLCQAVESAFSVQALDNSLLAVRSSAVAEDAQCSFAGQYESMLNVSPRNWKKAYIAVLASKYSAHALYYRVRQGYTDRQTPMAVLIMPMIEPFVSGIVYTRREHDPACMDIYMVQGVGQELASGSNYHARAAMRTTNDQWEVEQEGELLLGLDHLKKLYQAGQRLDQAFGSAQDVEWVVDTSQRLFIVQSRPLHFYTPQAPADSKPQGPVLGRGQWVSSGQAAGKIYRPTNQDSPFHVPSGSILVVSTLPPELTPALDRVGAVLARQGSPACHFASVAREAGVPVLCNTSGLEDIASDTLVSVDADQGLIMSGIHFSSPSPRTQSTESPQSEVQARLEKALPAIAALNLRDPGTDDFSIKNCKSLHDIVRFAHESGVREMFSLVGRRGLNRFGAKRLESSLPLVMHVLDVGHGLVPGTRKNKVVGINQIQSLPMRSLWSGLSAPGVQWDPAIIHYDWDAYYKSNANFTNVEKSTQFSSYAILADDYVHALLRFGYHFAVVDAVACDTLEHNYVHFSFKGGGGQDVQRLYRLRIITTVLEKFHFRFRLTADMLEAWFDRRDREESLQNLKILGFVLGKTVLLDMRIDSEERVKELSTEFLGQIYDFLPVQTPAG